MALRPRAAVVTLVAAGALTLAAAAPAAAAGSAPTAEHFSIVTTPEVDDILTPACGFTVTSAIDLRGVAITFPIGQPAGKVDLSANRNDVTFAGPTGKTVTFIERGLESATVNRDGTFTFVLAGREFGNSLIGRKAVVFNPATGEATVTQVGQSVNLADLCAALAP